MSEALVHWFSIGGFDFSLKTARKEKMIIISIAIIIQVVLKLVDIFPSSSEPLCNTFLQTAIVLHPSETVKNLHVGEIWY